MEEKFDLPLIERLRAIAILLPAFQEKDNEQSEQGVYAFEKAAYESGGVRPVDWMQWSKTPEAKALQDDASALAQATEDQLIHLITMCVRSERFCEGAMEAHYRSGLLTRIVERASAMLQELRAAEVDAGGSLESTIGEEG